MKAKLSIPNRTSSSVVICRDVTKPLDIETYENVSDVCALIFEKFNGVWPSSAKIYLEYVAKSCDVTPANEKQIAALNERKGKYIVVIEPGAWWIIILVVVAVIAAAAFFLMPKKPKLTDRGSTQSTNNALADRQNQQRINQRVPDIVGTVRSTPDLMQVPYRIFTNNVEQEVCYMGIGRGSYTINADDIRDDDTLLSSIPDEACAIYAPFTSPNSGDAPILQIGAPINDPVRNIKRVNGVNGQPLYAPNYDGVGDHTLHWTTPVIVSVSDVGSLIVNFFATAGLYLVQGDGDQFDVTVDLQLGVTPCKADGTPTGAEVIYPCSMTGDAITKQSVGFTLTVNVTATDSLSIRAVRTSETNNDNRQQQVDGVVWRDLYVCSSNKPHDFGDITTIQVKTIVNTQALALTERKINMLVTRNLPQRISGSTFTTELYPTNNAADILSFLALDPLVGNSNVDEVDFDNLYDTIDAVKLYFGVDSCGEFCYTFDDDDISAEETYAAVAQAVFCTAYRYGSRLSLFFEKETDDTVMLFGHRNIVPKSETRTPTFGYQENFDGVEYDWVDPNNGDLIATIYWPEDRSAINAKKVQSVGIRDNLHAYFDSLRYYNKLIYQNTNTEFDALQMGEILIRGNRIQCADTTEPNIQAGHVEEQDVLQLTLSQAATFQDGVDYVIFLQHDDGSVESIDITPVGDPDSTDTVLLANAPRLPLAIGDDLYASATYQIVGATDTDLRAFLVTAKDPADKATVKLTAVNYDARYYQNDQDFNEGKVDAGGSPTDGGTGIHAGKRSMLDKDLLFMTG